MATYVYIDGLNFYYGAVRKTPYKWTDFEALARRLVPKDSIGKIRYFSALVRPHFPGDRGPERQNVLFRALRANPLIEVHQGHFASQPRWRAIADLKYPLRELFRPTLRPSLLARAMFAEARRRRTDPVTVARVIVDEEKRSDVSLAAHLVYDAVTGACDKALLISNDGDLKEPIVLARSAGVPVGLVNPHPCGTNGRLRAAASFEIPFRREMVARCQMPNTVRDRKGRELHKPAEWR